MTARTISSRVTTEKMVLLALQTWRRCESYGQVANLKNNKVDVYQLPVEARVRLTCRKRSRNEILRKQALTSRGAQRSSNSIHHYGVTFLNLPKSSFVFLSVKRNLFRAVRSVSRRQPTALLKLYQIIGMRARRLNLVCSYSFSISPVMIMTVIKVSAENTKMRWQFW